MAKEDAYYHTDESAEEYIRLARDVNGIEHIEKLKPFLKSNASILELGTGPGSDWEILNAEYLVTGSDYSKAFLSRLIAKYPKGNFLKIDAKTINTLEQFDAIYSNKVLHHLTDEALALSVKNQWGGLNSNGLICHTFWQGQGTEEFKGMFVNYHKEADVKRFFGDQFEILVLERYAEFEANDSLLLIARMKK